MHGQITSTSKGFSMTVPATPRPRPAYEPHPRLRRPRVTDGRDVHALVAACAPLDTNSLYLNLLQCTHFAETCVVAERPESQRPVVGFVSGYLLPSRPTTLFIWQVAIASSERG